MKKLLIVAVVLVSLASESQACLFKRRAAAKRSTPSGAGAL